MQSKTAFSRKSYQASMRFEAAQSYLEFTGRIWTLSFKV